MAGKYGWSWVPVVIVLGVAAWARADTASAAERKLLGPGPAAWAGDLSPIGPADWSFDRARHLLERAGFGGTQDEIERLAAMTPEQAVDSLVNYERLDNSFLPPFEHSGAYDPGLELFPPSRPATTDLAKKTGAAIGVKVKPTGNRPVQHVTNKFFYWLRASRLEAHRIAYWWAHRMVATNRPLEEKMTLFWHGHFATNEEKVRDYRKMLIQLDTFRKHATGNFRDLMVAVAQDPAMLAFLDAGVNVKGAPNENFAREIMELFTMGVGNYKEQDIREAARAFTGWNFEDTKFVINADKHDESAKTVLGRTGNWDGVQVIDIIMEQQVTPRYIAGKLYRYLSRQELSPELQTELGKRFRDAKYQLKPLLRTIFLSKDFYSQPTWGTMIKGPVHLAISTYRKLGLKEAPGMPDFNEVTEGLGQHLMYPPTVAGWAHGRAWITPGLLLERGNFARDVLFPDINFIPHDRYPRDETIRVVSEKLALGYDISSATMPEAATGGEMAMSNMMADRDEDFNTRYASYRGWQMAIQKVKPIPRNAAQVDLAADVLSAGAKNTEQAVDYLLGRFLTVPIHAKQRTKLVQILNDELGTNDLNAARTYMEDGLRIITHLILSTPEYQLG